TRSWLGGVETSLGDLRDRVEALQALSPTLAGVEKQTQRITESMVSMETQREFLEDLHRRLTDLGATSSNLDERGRQLQTRMDAAEQRFVRLSSRAEEADKI